MIKKKELYTTTRDYFLTGKRFDISRSSIDGVLITTPQPKNLDRFYESPDYLSHDDSNSSLFAKLYRFARKQNIISKSKLISKFDNDGPVLDVGAGNGALVKYLKENKLDAYGYEPNESARKMAYQKGVRLLDHLPIRNTSTYHVIQMFHVLEHIRQPIELIEQLHSMLIDKGILIIALPNYKSLDCRLFGDHWAGYDVPRHLFHYEKKGLINLTESHFDCLETQPMWLDSFYVSILSARYKKWWFPMVSGIIVGMISNIAALFNSQPSSRIYILKKK